MSGRTVVQAGVFAGAAVSVWWSFSEPSRLMAGVDWLICDVLPTGPGLLAATVVAVAGFIGCRTGGRTPGFGTGGRGGDLACHRCDYRGSSVTDVAQHEAGHVVVAEALGYTVLGAKVWNDGNGVTWTREREKKPWDQIRISAAGASGENVTRLVFKAPINGWKSDKSTDAGKAYRIAPGLAAERGVSVKEMIALAEQDATRIINSRKDRWREVTEVLVRDRVYGQDPE